MTDADKTLIEHLHERTCAKGGEHYRDPLSGYLVFTRLKHLRRGYCCKSGCRHCPYGFSRKQNENQE